MASSNTTPAPVSSTPAGLLTAGEVSARYAEMRRRVNLVIPTSACLFRAMGDLCASAEAWWELRKKLKLQFSLRSRSEEVSRTVVVVA